MTKAPGLAEKVLLIHAGLDTQKVPHAFGGALALAYYGEPRLTIDIDLNLFVPASDADEVANSLSSVGADVADLDRVRAERDGQTRIWWGKNPIDLFFSYDPFHEAMAERTRTVPFGEGTIPILAPEHLIVCKAAFDRPKDWIDIEQMLAGTDSLDRVELDRWLGRVLGAGSENVVRVTDLWDATR